MTVIAITGGAGFIGRAFIESANQDGFMIKVLDNFDRQVHEMNASEKFRNDYPDVLLRVGDICNREDVDWLIDGADILIHLAAQTGTGQSMYEICRYTQTNLMGTANLLQALIDSQLKLKRFLLASSRSVYGEGEYGACTSCTSKPPLMVIRHQSDMKASRFEPICEKCGCDLTSVPTTEQCSTNPLSYYAETKLVQEKQVKLYNGKLFERLTIFRFQNVYGEGQSLSNPYTGILAIFSTLAKENQEINIFEDGMASRDFIHVSDIAAVMKQAVTDYAGDYNGTFNLGTGVAVSVLDVAQKIKEYFQSSSYLNISGDFRLGDIRHNSANMDHLKNIGIEVSSFINFEDGIIKFLRSIETADSSGAGYMKSIEELKASGMFVTAKKNK